MKLKYQASTQVIDVADWHEDREFSILPGTRVKSAHFCSSPNYQFCQPGHRYLFKLSSESRDGTDKYPEEFWIEIFAYQLGTLMGLEVPPAFVAINSSNGKSGAVIEWFLKGISIQGLGSSQATQFIQTEDFSSGGDFIQNEIIDYDRKKGTQHNFTTIAKLCARLQKQHILYTDWQSYWAKVLAFDALIGNGDRHQENWGFIKTIPLTQSLGFISTTAKHLSNHRLAPAFDNGSSMGREILEKDFKDFDVEKYVKKGTHHLRWDISTSKMGHAEMLINFCRSYPILRTAMIDFLKFKQNDIEAILSRLSSYNLPKPFVNLNTHRAEFMLKLLCFRQQYLLETLEKFL
jgi:hypothetical protein